MQKINKNSGQALLMVLLVVTVGLTIATSVFLESLNESAATVAEEESDKAFNAAEGEIERYLSGGVTSDEETWTDPDTGLSGTISVPTAGDTGSEIEYTINKNEIIELQIGIGVSSITLNWDDSTDKNVALLSKRTATDNTVSYEIYKERDSTLTVSYQGMTITDPGTINTTTGVKTNNIITTKLNSLRLMALGRKIKINIPEGQGIISYKVTSMGETESQIARGVELNKTGDYLPEVFDYSVYSAGGLSK